MKAARGEPGRRGCKGIACQPSAGWRRVKAAQSPFRASAAAVAARTAALGLGATPIGRRIGWRLARDTWVAWPVAARPGRRPGPRSSCQFYLLGSTLPLGPFVEPDWPLDSEPIAWSIICSPRVRSGRKYLAWPSASRARSIASMVDFWLALMPGRAIQCASLGPFQGLLGFPNAASTQRCLCVAQVLVSRSVLVSRRCRHMRRGERAPLRPLVVDVMPKGVPEPSPGY